MRFLEPDVADLVAVAGVPAQGRAPEAAGVFDQEQDELERVREADEVELVAAESARVGLPESSARRSCA